MDERDDPQFGRRVQSERAARLMDLLTNSIRQIFTDGSVSDVFGGENQLF